MKDHDPPSFTQWGYFYADGEFHTGRPMVRQDDGTYEYVGTVHAVKLDEDTWLSLTLEVEYSSGEWLDGVTLKLQASDVAFTLEPERKYCPECSINLPWDDVRRLHQFLGVLLGMHA